MLNSAGFEAFLTTTDDSAPLSNYMTVLLGSVKYMAELEQQLAEKDKEIEMLRELVVGRVKGTWPDSTGDYEEPIDWESWSLQLYGHEAGDLLLGEDAWDHIKRGLIGKKRFVEQGQEDETS